MARRILVGALVCLALMLAPPRAPRVPGEDPARKNIRSTSTKQPLTRALEQLYGQTTCSTATARPPEEERSSSGRCGQVHDRRRAAALAAPDRPDVHLDELHDDFHRATAAPAAEGEPPPQAKRPRNVGTSGAPCCAKSSKPAKPSRRSRRGRSSIHPITCLRRRAVLDPGLIQRTGEQLDCGSAEVLLAATAVPAAGRLPQQRRTVRRAAWLLGPDTTLVLINGRRAFASAASFTANAFDLNQIPLSAVERVEVRSTRSP